jgi:hypothetical protein
MCDDCGKTILTRSYRYNFDVSHIDICLNCLQSYLKGEDTNREDTSGYDGEISMVAPICLEDLMEK